MWILIYFINYRRVVWKHILNVYPDGMTGKERMDYMKRKSAEYYSLREVWRDCLQKSQVRFFGNETNVFQFLINIPINF